MGVVRQMIILKFVIVLSAYELKKALEICKVVSCSGVLHEHSPLQNFVMVCKGECTCSMHCEMPQTKNQHLPDSLQK